jgi:endonuclease G
MRTLLTVFWTLLTTILAAQPYAPSSGTGHQVVTYRQFTLSYNEQHEQADWVFYLLEKAELATNITRTDHFRADTAITTGSASLADYRNSGFTRGHLCPAANCEFDSTAYEESFLLSNMSPQLPGFNSGIWKSLEDWERKQANKYDSVWVVTGPVLVNPLGVLGDSKVTIPGYFFKACLRFEGSSPKTIGFLIPHVGPCGDLEDYVVPVNALESLTGLDFFPDLDTSTENVAEASVARSNWKF